jgi:hypothetical protein
MGIIDFTFVQAVDVHRNPVDVSGGRARGH